MKIQRKTEIFITFLFIGGWGIPTQSNPVTSIKYEQQLQFLFPFSKKSFWDSFSATSDYVFILYYT